MAAVEQELHERTESVVHSDAVFTSEQTLEKPQKGATLSHFFSGARRLFGRRSRSTSHSVVRTFGLERRFSASQKAPWRTYTGQRPAISAGVHYLPVSLSCATERVRPGRLASRPGENRSAMPSTSESEKSAFFKFSTVVCDRSWMAGVELAPASEPPARRPPSWGRHPPGVDPRHPHGVGRHPVSVRRGATQGLPQPGNPEVSAPSNRRLICSAMTGCELPYFVSC